MKFGAVNGPPEHVPVGNTRWRRPTDLRFGIAMLLDSFDPLSAQSESQCLSRCNDSKVKSL